MTDRERAVRHRLRATFDSAAELYHQARPGYPAGLYDELISLAGLEPASRLLEIGCGTGKATLPLARLGFEIACLEPGRNLAALAAGNLARYPAVTVVESGFENWDPPDQRPFDLVYAATSWHWIDPEARYGLAWRWLRPGGCLATWAASHVTPSGGDPFFAGIQDVYDEIGEGMPPGTRSPRPGELAGDGDSATGSGLFTMIATRHYDWEVLYTADAYIALLDTFSGHIAMEQWQRDRLYGEIRRRLAARPDGLLRRHWGAVLTVARRRDDAGPDRTPDAIRPAARFT
jgi:SAM-dependent methyltransferase